MVLKGFWLEAVLVVCTAFMFGVYMVRRKYRYFKERGIFYLEPTFLFGNTAGNILARESLSDTLLRLHTSMKGHSVGGAFQVPNLHNTTTKNTSLRLFTYKNKKNNHNEQ
jgi:hypothetical protein